MALVAVASKRAMNVGVPHIGPRKEKALRNSVRSPRIEDQVLSATPERTTPSPLTYLETLRPLYCSSLQNDGLTEQRNFIKGSELILEVNQAAHLPRSPITQAFSDFYFREIFHFVPVIDRGQAELESSVLLQQCLCFAGSTMRQSTEPREWSPTAIYGRIKTLLFLNYDPILMNTLTALCVLSTWLAYSPETIMLDSPWQWTEREEHGDTSSTTILCKWLALAHWSSRILLVDSSLQSSETYFGTWSYRKYAASSKQLCLWRECLTPELQLFDLTRKIRLSYSRSVVELHILYLGIVILICFLNHRENPLLFKYVSVAASSCISRLYEEILFHEEVTYLLPIHSWANLVASIPRSFGDIDILNPDRAKESRISRDVLTKMSEKHSSAAMVLNRINSPVDGDPIVFSAHNEPMSSLPVPIPDDKTHHLFPLFHFPEKFCPTLDLLRSADQAANCQLDSQPEWTMDDSSSWPIDWSLFLFDAPMSF
ncbi:hypothetical protein N7488_007725 [Penicillium malachiteum]|nr:hypothetical protein N7488_007725 [Penicillium malachiteum]